MDDGWEKVVVGGLGRGGKRASAETKNGRH